MQISDEMLRAAEQAMRDKRAELQHAPLDRIYTDLSRAALEAALSAMWQDISTAPKDGSEVLIYQAGQSHGYDYAVGRFLKYGWSNRNSAGMYNHPTHFMPLPPPPKIEIEG